MLLAQNKSNIRYRESSFQYSLSGFRIELTFKRTFLSFLSYIFCKQLRRISTSWNSQLRIKNYKYTDKTLDSGTKSKKEVENFVLYAVFIYTCIRFHRNHSPLKLFQSFFKTIINREKDLILIYVRHFRIEQKAPSRVEGYS